MDGVKYIDLVSLGSVRHGTTVRQRPRPVRLGLDTDLRHARHMQWLSTQLVTEGALDLKKDTNFQLNFPPKVRPIFQKMLSFSGLNFGG